MQDLTIREKVHNHKRYCILDGKPLSSRAFSGRAEKNKISLCQIHLLEKQNYDQLALIYRHAIINNDYSDELYAIQKMEELEQVLAKHERRLVPRKETEVET